MTSDLQWFRIERRIDVDQIDALRRELGELFEVVSAEHDARVEQRGRPVRQAHGRLPRSWCWFGWFGCVAVPGTNAFPHAGKANRSSRADKPCGAGTTRLNSKSTHHFARPPGNGGRCPPYGTVA